MKRVLLLLLACLCCSIGQAQNPAPKVYGFGGDVERKLPEGLVVSQLMGALDGPRIDRLFLVGYAKEAQVADGDHIGFYAVEDGLFKVGLETLHKYRVVEKPKK